MSNPSIDALVPADPADAVRAELQPELAADENVLATLAVDLDPALRFVPGALALTDRRFWARSPDGGWRSWPLQPELALRHADHAGVGSLELCDAHRRLARWRFTLACNPQALALLAAFERQQARLAGQGEAEDEPADDGSLGAREAQGPPSTWAALPVRTASSWRWVSG